MIKIKHNTLFFLLMAFVMTFFTISSAFALTCSEKNWLHDHTKQYYTFDGNANDYFGNWNGTLGSALRYDANDGLNGAYYFDGTENSYISFNPLSVHNLKEGAISIWFKLNDSITNSYQFVMSYKYTANPSNNQNLIAIYYKKATNELFVRGSHDDNYDGASQIYTTTIEYNIDLNITSTDMWHNVIVTIGNGTFGVGNKVYFDGELQTNYINGDNTTTYWFGNVMNGTTTGISFQLGRHEAYDSSQGIIEEHFFGGWIDEFAIFNTTEFLNDSYVQQIWNNGTMSSANRPINDTCETETTESTLFKYNSDDIAPATINGLAKFFIVLASMAGIIALIFIFNYIKSSFNK